MSTTFTHGESSLVPTPRNGPVETVVRPGVPARRAPATDAVKHVLGMPGEPLPLAVRAAMERSFRWNFADVRVHHDGSAARAAAALDANAFTVGRDIVFDAGRYDPDAPRGRSMLAHELTHVVQQQHARTPADAPALRIGPDDDVHEREALANEGAPGHVRVSRHVANGVVQRDKKTPSATPSYDVAALKAKVQAATATTFDAVVAAALQETATAVEAGAAVTVALAAELGRAIGDRLWQLAKDAADLGDESHFARLERTRAAVDTTLAAHGKAPASLKSAFDALKNNVEESGRGRTSIDFTRTVSADKKLVKVLVTGFDPFNDSDPSAPGKKGWNPSGAAALALDGTTIDVPPSAAAAVESTVLRVDFAAFTSGVVESIVRPLAAKRAVDAVVTVSEDPNVPQSGAVRLEQYAVGTRLDSKLERVPDDPAYTGTKPKTDPAILETAAPLGQIAADAERKASPGVTEIKKPAIGNWIVLRFASMADATAVLPQAKWKKFAAGPPVDVTIDDPATIAKVAASPRDASGPGVTIATSSTTNVHAVVVEGPGGNYMSNEISYRTQRTLREHAAADPTADPITSFHVHTQTGSVVPPGPSAKRTAAMAQRATLIETLQRIIASLTKTIVAKKKP